MKLSPPWTLKKLADFTGAQLIGNPEALVTGVNEIHMVEPGDLVFVDHPKYYNKALESSATFILINKEVDCPKGKGLLVHDKPFDAFNEINKHVQPFAPVAGNRGENVSVGEGSFVAPTAFLGNNVRVGQNCQIHPGAVLYDNCQIGDGVVVHAGAILGGYAFYYKKKEGIYDRMHTCGRVVVEDDVEIGAGTTIDRGVTGDTRIGKGTKIDNQVHIGHDTQIGEHCLFAAQVGIAGCVVVKNNVTLWGQVGLISDITIGENVVVLGQSGIMHDLEPNKTYFGSPADEAKRKFKELAHIRKLPNLIEKLNA